MGFKDSLQVEEVTGMKEMSAQWIYDGTACWDNDDINIMLTFRHADGDVSTSCFSSFAAKQCCSVFEHN